MRKLKNKNSVRKVIVLVLLATLIVFPAHADEKSDLEAENEQLSGQIAEEQARIDSLQDDIDDLETYVMALNEEIDRIQGIIDDYENQKAEKYANIDVLNANIADLEVQIVAKEEEMAAQYAQMKKRIKFIYENVDDSYFEALLSSKTFSEAIVKIQYMLELTSYDRRMMKEIQALKDGIAADKAQIEAEVVEIEEEVAGINLLEGAQEEQQALLDSAVEMKETEIAEREAEINESQQIIDAMASIIAENQAEIESIVAEYEAELERQRQEAAAAIAAGQSYEYTSTSDQGFIWPLPSGYQMVTSWYGWRYDADVLATGASTFHSGIDIYAPDGTPIYAVKDGIVVAAGYDNGIGYNVVIYHGDGLYTECHHMCDYYVSVGEIVGQGQTIGGVGQTGWYCTGSHLHFGVCYGTDVTSALSGDFVDPAPYLGL